MSICRGQTLKAVVSHLQLKQINLMQVQWPSLRLFTFSITLNQHSFWFSLFTSRPATNQKCQQVPTCDVQSMTCTCTYLSCLIYTRSSPDNVNDIIFRKNKQKTYENTLLKPRCTNNSHPSNIFILNRLNLTPKCIFIHRKQKLMDICGPINFLKTYRQYICPSYYHYKIGMHAWILHVFSNQIYF